MVVLTEETKNMLKKPLGRVYKTYEEILKLSKRYRIVAVGDITTLALLAMGILPHLAVFDYRVMRKALKEPRANILRWTFKHAKKIKNPQGTISDTILKNAKSLLKHGGAIAIDGEEDLTALAFIRHADKKTIVMYGQPHEGVVIVMPNQKTKKLVEKIFKLILYKREKKNQK